MFDSHCDTLSVGRIVRLTDEVVTVIGLNCVLKITRIMIEMFSYPPTGV